MIEVSFYRRYELLAQRPNPLPFGDVLANQPVGVLIETARAAPPAPASADRKSGTDEQRKLTSQSGP